MHEKLQLQNPLQSFPLLHPGRGRSYAVFWGFEVQNSTCIDFPVWAFLSVVSAVLVETWLLD